MANWFQGYTAEWVVRTVDPDTWADNGTVGSVREISVSRDCTDDVPLLETGSMELDSAAPFESAWCRVYMVADQGGKESVAAATLLFERSSSRFEHDTWHGSMQGRSVLQPAADRKMARGAFAAVGTDGAREAGRLLSECTPAPVVVEGSFTLAENIVFDLGCSYLQAAWQLLDAAGWCIQIDGDGTVHVLPMPKEPSLELSHANAGLLIPGIDDDYSLVDIPNRYYAVDDGAVAVAVNEDPSSPTSYQARGRWVDEVDESPTPVDGETLELYARRKLAEAATLTHSYTYDREWWPGVTCYSTVRATMEDNGIVGDLRVLKQDLACGMGIVVTETAGMEVRV